MHLINASRICSVRLVKELWKRQQLSTLYKINKFEPPKTLNDNTIKSYLVPNSFGIRYIDELHGKPIKTDFSNMYVLDPTNYDKYAGEGVFARIVKELSGELSKH